MNYQLVRSERRKSIAIQVREQRVIVRAPLFVCETVIDKFVAKKRLWIEEHLKRQVKNSQFHCDFSCGSQLMLGGKLKTIQVLFGRKSSVEELDGQVVVTLANRIKAEPNQAVKRLLEKYFQTKASTYILPKIDTYAEQMSTSYTRVNIRKFSARWGSCTSNGALSFNYLLMMAPDWVIDYVIVHELAHRFHMDHSKAFWQKVAAYHPQYQSAKSWFNTFQPYLHWH